MKILFILPLAFIMASCFVPRSKRAPNLTMATPIEISISEINEGLYGSETAPIQIDSISISQNILTLRYSCAFNPGRLVLVGSPMLAKSFPPIRNCKFVIQENNLKKDSKNEPTYLGIQHFELNPLAHKFVKDAPTYLQIEGWPEKILFIYPE
ncbi:MAG: hypothetical protein ACKOBN_03930 [Flavobacteriales bacterium]